MSADRVIRVFIASPGDLAVERRAFKEVVDALNKWYGRGARVTFEPLAWEDALSPIGRRPQSTINNEVDHCDVFLLVMWKRWGQKAPDAAPYDSYTEEEFHRALTRFHEEGKPAIFGLFKHVDPGYMADPGPQLRKVLAFRKKLEKKYGALLRTFQDEQSFRDEIDKHLTAFAEGKFVGIGDVGVLRNPYTGGRKLDDSSVAEQLLSELEMLRAETNVTRQQAEIAWAAARDADIAKRAAERKADANSLALAESAARAATDGRLEAARQDFAKAVDGSNNLRVVIMGLRFFLQIGELEETERLARRFIALGDRDTLALTAGGYALLGNVLRERGDLDAAEGSYRKGLGIYQQLGHQEGTAACYRCIGVIRLMRSDFDSAEEMYRKSVAIEEELGHCEHMALDYSNLGSALFEGGHLKAALESLTKSRDLYDRIGSHDRAKDVLEEMNTMREIRQLEAEQLVRSPGDSRETERMK
jgi:tetratricopeptide (TPR) repeat protein